MADAEGMFTLLQMAQHHAGLDGRDPDTVHAQYRGFHNAGLIRETVPGAGRTSANFYDINVSARLRLLSPLYLAFGVNTDALRQIDNQLRAEEIDVRPDGTEIRSGLVAALNGVRRGQDWTLGVQLLQDTETGEARFAAKLVPTEELEDPVEQKYAPMSPLQLRAFIRIAATELLRPLLIPSEDRPRPQPKRNDGLEARLRAREAEIAALLAGRDPEELTGADRLIWAALRRSRGMLLYRLMNED